MLHSVANAKSRLRVLALLSISVIALSSAIIVHAADTTVNLAVCGSGAGATLTIDLPINDSVIDQPTVQVSGTVSNASQIDVSVDSQYYSTVPLSPGQTNYSTPVQLTQGTHTISLVGNDVCHVQDGQDSVVVTYQPQVNPSTGGSTPTEVGDGNGAVINDEPVNASDNKPIGMESWPVVGPLIRLGQGLAVGLDFEVGTSSGTLWRSVVRFSFIVIGISVMAFGNIAISAWGWTHGKISPAKRWGLRCLGIVALILGFVI